MAATGQNSTAYGNRLLVTVAVMTAAFMQSVDISIANVAVPHMQGSLSAAQDQITWVLTSYIVAAAIMIPLSGWLAQRFGRKRVLLASVAGFTIASVLCGAATTLPQMVAFRLLQGVCGAALQPLAQAVLLDINPRERHGRAMATWGMGITVAPLFGPTLGGWITESYSWRWVFYINLPFGILAFLGLLLFFREQRTVEPRPFDFFGFASLSIAVGALQMMLDRGQQNDWFDAGETIVEAAIAAGAFWVFAVHSATAKHSFINLRMLRDQTFVSSCILIFIMASIFNSTISLVQPMLQSQLGYSAFFSGWVVMPRSIANMIGLYIVGRLLNRVDPRVFLLMGFIITSIGMRMMGSLSPDTDPGPIVIASIIQGAGVGCIFAPLSTAAFMTLQPQLRTEGATLYSLVRNIGGSTGISFFQTILSRNIQTNHEHLAAQITPFNQALIHPSVQAIWNLHTDQGLALLNREVTRQAVMMAYMDDFRLMSLELICAIPVLLLLRLKRPQAPITAAAPVTKPAE